MDESEVPEIDETATSDVGHPSQLPESVQLPTGMSLSETSDLLEDSEILEGPDSPSRWQENHGTLLMGFVCVILMLGSVFLAYRQNRFVPPRFPDGQFIETVGEDDPLADEVGEDAVAIEVTGAVNDSGKIAIAIFDAQTNFNQPAEATLAYAGDVVEGVTRWRIPREELPSSFAVAAYHDENMDSELNRNRFGIPTERYGFSSNARGIVGPPSFGEAVISRPKSGETIVITIR